jgi:hypothetical protein
MCTESNHSLFGMKMYAIDVDCVRMLSRFFRRSKFCVNINQSISKQALLMDVYSNDRTAQVTQNFNVAKIRT